MSCIYTIYKVPRMTAPALLQPQQELQLDEKLLPDELTEIFTKHKEHKVLKSLILKACNFDETSVARLCDCIQSNAFEEISLVNTLLLPESWVKLIEALASHSAVKQVAFLDCRIPDDKAVKIALKKLLSRSKTLENINMSGHCFENVNEFENALSHSYALMKVIGLHEKPSPKIRSRFEQNIIFHQMNTLLNEWAVEKVPFEALLITNKNIFYKLVKQLTAIQAHDTKRLNEMMARFYLYLANEYQVIGNVAKAKEYYQRVCNTKTVKFQAAAHQALGEIFFVTPQSIPNEEKQQPTEKLDIMIAHVKQLLKSHKHLSIACQLTDNPAPALLNRYVKAGLGKTLVDLANEFNQESEAGFAAENRINAFQT